MLPFCRPDLRLQERRKARAAFRALSDPEKAGFPPDRLTVQKLPGGGDKEVGTLAIVDRAAAQHQQNVLRKVELLADEGARIAPRQSAEPIGNQSLASNQNLSCRDASRRACAIQHVAARKHHAAGGLVDFLESPHLIEFGRFVYKRHHRYAPA